MKKFASHIQRVAIENKAGLVATMTDNLEFIVLKVKVAQLESNMVINAGPDVKRKCHDNNKKNGPKDITTCTVCQKTGQKVETDTILSLDVFLEAKFKVDFTVGTEEDPSFGGRLPYNSNGDQ
jgi:hypothetical protein